MNDDLEIFNLYLEAAHGEPQMTEDKHGTKRWWLHNVLHREDGPAVETSNGKSWFRNGKLHREDGPAVEQYSGELFWALNGLIYSTAQHWAEAVLAKQGKLNDAADVDAFLKPLLKKDVEEAL